MGELKDSDQRHRSRMQKKAVHVSSPLQSLLNPLISQNDEDSDELSSEASPSKDHNGSNELNESNKLNESNELNEQNKSNDLNDLNESNGLSGLSGLVEPLGEDELSTSSSSSEEIATPLAIRSEKVMNKQDAEASENRTMLSRGFNSNCVRYSFPKHCVVC